MKHFRLLASLVVVLGCPGLSGAQDFQEINQLWHQTLDALGRGQKDRAREIFGEFNQKVRSYLKANGRSWQIEYLAGSLECQFLESKARGAKLLRDILQNNRDLNRAGEDELQRQLAACSAPPAAAISDAPRDLPVDIAASSAHFQTPGVHGDMKGGYTYRLESESAVAVSPKPASELLARRVQLSEPQKALDAALTRLPAGASGSIVHGFAVTTSRQDKSRALGIGKCLETYSRPLEEEFKIEPSSYMVTIYTAESTDQVYDYARSLHGLQLPRGVVAYSVPEDMSLSGVAEPGACGSIAHELVHLLIKRRFPMSPAWLEEGLASEVAVASPESSRFKFSYSWRDDALKHNSGLRPRVGELLDMPWSDFNASDQFKLQQASAVQATAAVFIRYLDRRGKLSDVYFAVRDQHFSPDLSQYRSYREILEEKLGKSVNDIEHDFEKWFRQQK